MIHCSVAMETSVDHRYKPPEGELNHSGTLYDLDLDRNIDPEVKELLRSLLCDNSPENGNSSNNPTKGGD